MIKSGFTNALSAETKIFGDLVNDFYLKGKVNQGGIESTVKLSPQSREQETRALGYVCLQALHLK